MANRLPNEIMKNIVLYCLPVKTPSCHSWCSMCGEHTPTNKKSDKYCAECSCRIFMNSGHVVKDPSKAPPYTQQELEQAVTYLQETYSL